MFFKIQTLVYYKLQKVIKMFKIMNYCDEVEVIIMFSNFAICEIKLIEFTNFISI